MRGALASLLLILGGCSAADIQDGTHKAAVITVPTALAYLFNPWAAPVVLGATAAMEFLIPDGTEEHVREGKRELIDRLEDERSTEPLPARLQRIKDEVDAAGSLGKDLAAFLDRVLVWGGLLVAGVVGFQLWHFWFGSLRSRALSGKDEGAP